MMTTSSEEILETINSFKNLQNWEYHGKAGDRGISGRSFHDRVGKNGT